MEDIVDYKKRDLLYKDLVQKFDLKKVNEKYYDEYFGDFFITLSSETILIEYINERSYLTIKIAGSIEPPKWVELSYIIDLINDTQTAIVYQRLTNKNRIEKFNLFLSENFEIIANLFKEDNYQNTSERLEKLVKENFYGNFNQK